MRIPLIGGAYTARSIIADAQRCINLYAEQNPEEAESPFTHYPTPGTSLLAKPPVPDIGRCAYRATNGDLYVVIGVNVYYVSSTWTFTQLGTIAVGAGRCHMADNGLAVVLVDGTSSGYAIDMTSKAFGNISSTAFYGADRVDYVDTYFLFNRPGTGQMYISMSNANYVLLTGGGAFDPLDIASKTGGADPLAGLIVMHREPWLIGTETSEVWYNSGAADFTFAELPGAFIEHGCIAKDSIAKQDLAVYWLSQDKQGQTIVMRGSEYMAERISTHAIETEFASYSTISDALSVTYQQLGHTFYGLIFPTADTAWFYDEATKLWHQRASTDTNGVLHRPRYNCVANAYQKIVGLDYATGSLLSIDPNVYTDYIDGAGPYTDSTYPIPRIRTWPPFVQDGKRVIYDQFIAEMETGTNDGSIDGTSQSNPPTVSLRWSDDYGKTWGNSVRQSLGALGQYLTTLQWRRLGKSRFRVFELSWSAPQKTALNGAFLMEDELAS